MLNYLLVIITLPLIYIIHDRYIRTRFQYVRWIKQNIFGKVLKQKKVDLKDVLPEESREQEEADVSRDRIEAEEPATENTSTKSVSSETPEPEHEKIERRKQKRKRYEHNRYYNFEPLKLVPEG